MQTEYTGRQMTVTQTLRAQAATGLERIERIIGRSAKAHVVLTTDKYRQVAEIKVNWGQPEIVGWGEATVMGAALQTALDKAEKQALRQKEKVIGRKRNARISKDDLHVQAIAM
ncbi:MAG TPA: ribosome-associated translation inhibitor RaiA [Acidobacteriaceae bacterium]